MNYDISSINGMTDITSLFKTYSTVGIVMVVLLIIAYWRIFEKAGEAGWKSLIPIYNVYILWKIGGLNFLKFFLIVIVASFLMGFIAGITNSALITTILYFAIIIYALVMSWRLCKNLSTSFGHSTGFALGLFFFMPIFLLILGFNSDTYHKAA